MDHRRALATVAAVTIGATAIAAAVGATTRVFNVAEASPGVGRVSPVSTPTLAPVVEPRVLDSEHPATPVPPVAGGSTASGDPSTRRTAVATGGAPNVASTAPATATPRRESEPRGDDD